MRLSLLLLFTLVFASLSFTRPVRGDIILTIDVGVIEPNSPFGVVDIFARSDAGDRLISLTVDFELSAGRFDSTPGIFGAAGMLGAGNLHAASDFIRNDDISASLSIDFNSSQAMDGNDVLLTTLRINAFGLADGFYSIAIIDRLAFGDGGEVTTRVTDFGHPGGFFVETVPEPSSTLALLLLGIFALQWRSIGRSKA